MSTDSVDTNDDSHFSKFDTRFYGLIQLRVCLTAGGIQFTLTSRIATKQRCGFTVLACSYRQAGVLFYNTLY